MAKEYQIDIPGHPNIYSGAFRSLKVYFCEPSHGVNSETGILLLIPGFGGNSNSKVYSKMRSNFADQYNLVTVQCDYFGLEFMQKGTGKIKPDPIFDSTKLSPVEIEQFNSLTGIAALTYLFSMSEKYSMNVYCFEDIDETIDNFNDMGLMQALDNITAVMIVANILWDNKLHFNTGRIISYGHSHGAYLAHLCNAFTRDLFSLIIDNSAWLFPNYLLDRNKEVPNLLKRIPKKERLSYKLKRGEIFIISDYLASHMDLDYEILYLPTLYNKVKNRSNIIAFHGTADTIIDCNFKEEFFRSIPNCNYKIISPNDVDGKIFHSAVHGLDADFIEMFQHVMAKQQNNFIFKSSIDLPNIEITTSQYQYRFEYSQGVPNLTRIEST